MMDIPEEWYGHAGDPEVIYRCATCKRSLAKQPDGTFRHIARGYPFDDHAKFDRERREAAKLARIKAEGGSPRSAFHV